jgi:mannose-1-phosphate guanylyltransferase
MRMNYPTSRNACSRRSEWAVILAGGDGTRLKPLTRKIAGDERPKQFCSVLGRRTLLEETRSRVALEIARERTLYVVNRLHKPYYTSILPSEPASNFAVQPSNRGTAPAILYSLMRIAAIDPEAQVAFFPSDHYISNDKSFMSHIRSALNTVSQRLDLVILLGLDPETPEVEYGWIEPAEPIRRQSHIYGVRRFWEKPNQFLAQVLQLRGCLWNSFVMVASVQALLGIMQSAVPRLYDSFARLAPFFGTLAEPELIDRLYERSEEVNFSHQVLAHCPHRLAVLKVTGVRWSDLGEPNRVMASLNTAGIRPHWMDAALPQFA